MNPLGSGSVRLCNRRTSAESFERNEFGGPVGGAFWPRSVTNSMPGSVVVGVGELLEEPTFFGVVDHRFPFALIGINELTASVARARPRCRGGRDDHVAKVLDPALHVLEPDRSPGQAVGRADVVHEEPVEIAKRGVLVEVGGERDRRAEAGRRRCRRRRGCTPSRWRSVRSPCSGPRRTRGRTLRRLLSACEGERSPR